MYNKSCKLFLIIFNISLFVLFGQSKDELKVLLQQSGMSIDQIEKIVKSQGGSLKDIDSENSINKNNIIDKEKIKQELEQEIKESITLSVIGCVVNGPGEASQTQIGLTGGGQGNHMMYLSGVPFKKVASDKIIKEIVSLVEKKSKELRNN